MLTRFVKFVGWVESSEPSAILWVQHSLGVGFRSSTQPTRYTINKLSICTLYTLIILLVLFCQNSIANAEKLTCFVDICIDPSSVELTKSDVAGAPPYAVRIILGTQKFSNEKLLAQMEVNCRQRQFRTVRVSEDGENWSNFDPRWTVIAENSSLSRLVDYTCQLPIAR